MMVNDNVELSFNMDPTVGLMVNIQMEMDWSDGVEILEVQILITLIQIVMEL